MARRWGIALPALLVVAGALWWLSSNLLIEGAVSVTLAPTLLAGAIAQSVVIAALVALDARRPLSVERARPAVVGCCVAMAASGSVAVCCSLIGGAPAWLVPIAAVANAVASAPVVLTLACSLSTLPPRSSSVCVAASFLLASVLTEALVTVGGAALCALVAALPLALGACLARCLPPSPLAGAPAREVRPVAPGTMRRLPWGMAVLLVACQLAHAVVGALLPGGVTVPAFGQNASWIAVYLIVLVTLVVWGGPLRRDDPERLWPAFALLVFTGLFFFSLGGQGRLTWVQALLWSTKGVLMPFAWILVACVCYRSALPRVRFSGLGLLVFDETSRVLSVALGGRAAETAGAASTLVAGALAFAIICATVLMLAGEALRRPDATGEGAAAGGGAGAWAGEADPRAVMGEIFARRGLTPREEQVATLLSRGYTLPRVAEELGISLDTVRAHSKAVYRKLGIHKKQELLDMVDERMATRTVNGDAQGAGAAGRARRRGTGTSGGAGAGGEG
ncbi:MAG: LuxR C-terminal-related transcriptional regulator [Coriobacteriales bacterium]